MSVIPLSQPDINEADIEAVVDTLRSGRLSLGPRQARFEELIAERAGTRHAVAVSSGTAGLHLVMLGLGIGPGDEVITTPFSFIASANCIRYVGATPVFVDICPRSLNMDPAKVEAAVTDRTRAILAVEVFGSPTHMDRLAQIARHHEIPLVEDCCEALGGRFRGKPLGSFGRAGVFAFYPNKQITTGEGGMIVTDDDHLADMCRVLRNQGRATESMADQPGAAVGNRAGSWLAHERLGYNYRLSEIACALGISQMDRLDDMLERRRNVAAAYMRQMMDISDIVLPNVPPGADDLMSWFVFVVRLSATYDRDARDRIIAGMRRHDIGASNYFPCIHLQPAYTGLPRCEPGCFPIAESISERTIALPFYNRLDDNDIQLVVHTLKVMIQREQLARRD